MSKVEKALQKARAQEGLETIAHGQASVVQEPLPQEGLEAISPALDGSQQVLRKTTTTELRPYKHEISHMAEPWRLSEADLAEAKIIYPDMEETKIADAFRTIRTRIVQERPGGNCSVLVTSVVDGGGSSFVALNLATAFSFDESRTAILIDCNLREPAHDFLAAPSMQYGLTDYLETPDMDATQIIQPAGIPRLRLIPAGRKTEIPTEQLDSRKMRDLLMGVRQRYQDRYVILDTASMSEAADAKILAALADYVLLVVPYGRTTESQIWNAAKAIDERKLLGVVFNDEPQIPSLSWK